MRFAAPIGLLLALGAASAAQACDQHGSDYGPMSAYYSYRDMNEHERWAADVAARDAMREKDILEARNMLLSRFSIKVERGPDEPQLAEASDGKTKQR